MIRRALAGTCALALCMGAAGDTTFEFTVDFEGIADLAAVGTVSGAVDVTFDAEWLALVDSDAGGSGNFANEPSPDTVAFTQSAGTRLVDLSSAVREISVHYAASVPLTVTAYSGAEGTGSVVDTVVAPPFGLDSDFGGPTDCAGDPTGAFCAFTEIVLDGGAEGIRSLTFAGTANQWAIDDIEIVGGCAYSIDPGMNAVGWFGGTPSIEVTAVPSSCSWTATSNASWIEITDGASGTGSGTVEYRVGRNTAGGRRTGTITVAGHEFSLLQTEFGCDFAVAPTSLAVDALGGTSTLNVTMGSSACTWGITPGESWAGVVGSLSRTGSDLVLLELTPNLRPDTRTTTLVVAGRSVGVTQGGIDDTPTPLSPIDLALKPRGSTNARIVLTWDDRADDEAGFQITRTEMAAARRPALPRLSSLAAMPEIFYVSADTERFVDRGLTADTRYCYEVRAYNAGGVSRPLKTAGCARTRPAAGGR